MRYRFRSRRLVFESLETRHLLAVVNPVADTTLYPHRAAVQLMAAWDSNNNHHLDRSDTVANCSGAMVSSYQVLTAAHCLYDHDEGGYVDWVFAHPGRDGKYDRPYGEAEGREWVVPTAYQNGNTGTQWDLGVVALDRNIGDFTGWFGVNAVENLDRYYALDPYEVTVLHYPSKHGFDGEQQQQGGAVSFLKYQSSLAWRMDMDVLWTAKGSSGSAMFTSDGPFDHTIIGVLSEGDDIPPGSSGTDWYVRIDAMRLAWIQARLGDTSRPSDRAVLVDRDHWFDSSLSYLNDTTPVTGQALRANAVIFNAGTKDAANVTVRFRLSDDSDYDSGDPLLGDVTIPSLNALQSRTASLDFTMPGGHLGRRYVVWTTDPENTVSEFDAPFQDVHVNCHRVGSGSDCESGHARHGNIAINLSDDNYEQNDSLSIAESLPEGTWLSSIDGKGRQYDDDYFEIVVPYGRERVKVDLRFQHREGDIDLALYGSSGERLASSTSTSDNESIDFLVPASGTYYLRVYYGDEGNLYDLRWDAIGPPDLTGVEFDLSRTSATAGNEVTARFKVTNLGGAVGEVRVGFYLSKDATITPSDRLLGTYDIASLGQGATTERLSKSLRLPAPGDSFWAADGTYYLGMIVDSDNEIAEANESNNANSGGGLDRASLEMTIHPYGTFQVINPVESNRITLPRFDTSLGELERVVVVAYMQNSYTGPGGSINCPTCPSPSHAVNFQIGPFLFQSVAIPLHPFLTPNHVHLIVPNGASKEFTGSQLAPFRNGTQTFNLPSSLVTSTDFSHNHPITDVQFVTTTTFYFDPPDPDLHTNTFSLRDSGRTFFGGEAITLDLEIENDGDGLSLPFTAKFFLSQDATITTDDVALGTARVAEGLELNERRQWTITQRLPHAAANSWLGDGRYYVGVILDYDQQVEETNETNNASRGIGVDLAPIDIVVHRPGTFSFLTSSINQIDLPAFDANLGQLTQTDVSVTLVNGLTDGGGPISCATCPPFVHDHLFRYDIDRFHFEAYAIPLPSPAAHPIVNAAPPSKYTYTGDELDSFRRGPQTLTADTSIVSSEGFGHTHTLTTAVYLVETIFHFDRLPDLRAAAMAIDPSSPAPGQAVQVTYQIENVGLAASPAARVQFWLGRSGLGGANDLLLGTRDLDPLTPGSTSLPSVAELTLPFGDDPFWSGDGTYSLRLVVDPDNEVLEQVEENNASTGLNRDFVTFSLEFPDPAPPRNLGMSGFADLPSQDPTAGDQWYEIEASRSGPLTVWAIGDSSGGVRLSLYRLSSERGGAGEGPLLVGRAVSVVSDARLDHPATAGDRFLLRLAGESPDVRLRIANLLEVDGPAATVHGTAASDQFRVGLTGGDFVSVNGVRYSLDALSVEEVKLDGGGADDHFDITALPHIRIQVEASSSSLDTVEIQARGETVQWTGSHVQLPGRADIELLHTDRIRAVEARSWHNVFNRHDVNNDFMVVPLDALIVINDLNTSGARRLNELPSFSQLPVMHIDTNGDGQVSPIDVLLIVNRLNTSFDDGEGELPVVSSAIPPGTGFFSLHAADEGATEKAEVPMMLPLALQAAWHLRPSNLWQAQATADQELLSTHLRDVVFTEEDTLLDVVAALLLSELADFCR